MFCYRCEKDLSEDESPKCVDLGYDLHAWICSDCRRILLRDAVTELFMSRIEGRVRE